MKHIITFFIGLSLLSCCLTAEASTVPVHDPSIVVVYKDAAGNSFPDQDASGSRTKYYYIFGTQLGAAYSTDMLDWNYFTPTFSANGNETDDYMLVFQESNGWSGWSSNDKLKENLWAPDIIYNRKMKKWCLYFSVNGDDWLSSIALLTSDKIEGPYAFQGTVVCSGMDNNSTGLGNNDYAQIMGTTQVDARYMKEGAWTGTYGSSCIDPTVLYDEQGVLWMVYGSWSGGIFLLKLDEATGLRDRTHTFGYNTKEAVWNGNTLKYDPYMGLHLAGGYYVSGEGSYIEYITDPDGKGYYYLFLSYGFYAPEGGYNMRVFRSATIDGEYKDVTNDSALFSKYLLNYGNNVQLGVSFMQNYKWSWWSIGQTAQGHNSVLQDEDGHTYLIYHTKYDNGTIHHNVEVHQLLFSRDGWPLASPFEYRVGEYVSDSIYSQEELSGEYHIIVHNTVDYKKLQCNQEQTLYLNANGTLSGAYSGTWSYDFANGRQFLTLATNAGTFNGVLIEQRMDGKSTRTLAFTSMNPDNELCVWGYRQPLTYTTQTTHYTREALLVGNKKTKELAWNDYSQFHKTTISGDFEIEYAFTNYTEAAKNWHNWAIAVNNRSETWYVRADVWNNSTFTGSNVSFHHDNPDFLTLFQNKPVRVKLRRIGTSYDLFVYVEETLVITGSASGCTADQEVDVYLGGEACYLDVHKISVSNISDREAIGTCNDDGTYTVGFNKAKGTQHTYKGDFQATYRFVNYRNEKSTDVWDNYLLVETTGSKTAYIRADDYAWDYEGTLTFDSSWGDDWNSFLRFMQGANVELFVERQGETITYIFDIEATNGTHHTHQVTHSGITSNNITLHFTCEESLLDFYQYEQTTTVEGTGEAISTHLSDNKSNDYNILWWYKGNTLCLISREARQLPLYDVNGKIWKVLHLEANQQVHVDNLPSGIYLVGSQKIVIR